MVQNDNFSSVKILSDFFVARFNWPSFPFDVPEIPFGRGHTIRL